MSLAGTISNVTESLWLKICRLEVVSNYQMAAYLWLITGLTYFCRPYLVFLEQTITCSRTPYNPTFHFVSFQHHQTQSCCSHFGFQSLVEIHSLALLWRLFLGLFEACIWWTGIYHGYQFAALGFFCRGTVRRQKKKKT